MLQSVCSISRKSVTRLIAGAGAVVILFVIYREFNPDSSALFPKCPFMVLTGLKCPGCGSQRAIHHLLNLEIIAAVRENALMVLSIPYLAVGITLDCLRNSSAECNIIRNKFYGRYAIYASACIILLFWILRNINIMEIL